MGQGQVRTGEMMDPKDKEAWKKGRPYIELGIAVLLLLVNTNKERDANHPGYYFEAAGLLLNEFEKRNH